MLEPETQAADTETQDTTADLAVDEPESDEPSADAAASEEMVPASEVQRLIEKAVTDRLSRERRKQQQAKPEDAKAKPRKQDHRTNGTDVNAVVAEAVKRATTTERLASTLSLNERQRTVLERHLESVSIEDLADEASGFAESMGWRTPETKQENTQDPVKTVKSRTPPASDGGPPKSAASYRTSGNPSDLTKADYQSMVSELGVQKAQRKVREMAERWFSGKNVSLK